MADEEPWDDYDRDKLPKRWAYPIGRDAVSAALVSAGVHLDRLAFNGPASSYESADLNVLWVRWLSDAPTTYLVGCGTRTSQLTMWLSSVPSEFRQEIGHQLTDGWLEKALAWAQQAPRRGNAWTASDHDWFLIRKPDGRLIAEED